MYVLAVTHLPGTTSFLELGTVDYCDRHCTRPRPGMPDPLDREIRRRLL